MRTPSLRGVGGVLIAIISPPLRGPLLGAECRWLTALCGRTESREQCLFAVNASFYAVHRNEERCAHAECCEPREQTVRIIVRGDAVERADAQ